MTYPIPPRKRARNANLKQGEGMISQCSTRFAAGGGYAHCFYIGRNRYSIFIDDDLSPVVDGDTIRFEYEVRHLKSKSRKMYFSVLNDSIIVASPVEISAVVKGHVYIVSNPSMPGLLKIGFTTGTVSKRVSELSGVTSVPTGFRIEWSYPVMGDPRSVEQQAHAHLAHARTGKEFFRTSLDEAKNAIIQSFVEHYPEQALKMESAFSLRAENIIKRRQKIVETRIREAAELDLRRRQADFDSSREGQWRLNGSIVLTLLDWIEIPATHSPSPIARLFGAKAKDYVEVKATATQIDENVAWVVLANGRINGKGIYDRYTCTTREEALDRIQKADQMFSGINRHLSILVPNRLIESPPHLPENVGRTNYVLQVSTLDGLLIRSMKSKSRGS